MVAAPATNFRGGDLKLSDQNNFGGEPEQKIQFGGGGELNFRGWGDLCVTTTNMLVFWPACLSCLPVSQTSMNDSGHKGNIGQLLNSRVLGVLLVITLFMTQVSVYQCQSKLHSVPPSFLQGGLSLQTNLKKRGGGLTVSQLLEGGCWERGR